MRSVLLTRPVLVTGQWLHFAPWKEQPLLVILVRSPFMKIWNPITQVSSFVVLMPVLIVWLENGDTTALDSFCSQVRTTRTSFPVILCVMKIAFGRFCSVDIARHFAILVPDWELPGVRRLIPSL